MKNRALSVRRMVMLFLIIGMLVMSVTAFAATATFSNVFLSVSNNGHIIDAASTSTGNRWCRVNIISAQPALSSSKYITLSLKEKNKPTSAVVSKQSAKVTSVSQLKTLYLKDSFSGTTYYVHGKLSASTPYGCTISGYVEF